MHYYQFHIGDYISHTIHLSPEEDLAYRRLLDMYYDTERPIPNNIPLVSRRLRLGSDVVQSILDEFFQASEEGYKNRRADLEIREYKEFIDKQKRNGKLGGRPKKTQRKPTAIPDLTQKKPNQEPLTINHKPIDTPDGVSDSVWQDFKAIRKAKKAPITQRVIDGLKAEADKAGWTFEQALTECCLRGWQAFKADWVKDRHIAKQDIVHVTVPSKQERDPELVRIESERNRAAPVPESVRMLAKQWKVSQ
jgi:uncharacterized protein YdaU (DUF1376 family)